MARHLLKRSLQLTNCPYWNIATIICSPGGASSPPTIRVLVALVFPHRAGKTLGRPGCGGGRTGGFGTNGGGISPVDSPKKNADESTFSIPVGYEQHT